MPKVVKELSAIEVKRLDGDGRYAVGGVAGLTLHVRGASKTWSFRTMVLGKRKDLGLGAYPAVGVGDARQKARDLLANIAKGQDPVAERQKLRDKAVWTFDRCAAEYIALHRPGWKNAKHALQWERTLEQYVSPLLGAKPIADIDAADVLRVIQPHWTGKNETMVRVRNRIELIIGWAMAVGHRARGLNPAAWRGNLDAALPKPSKVNKRTSFAAIPVDEIPGFVQKLREVEGTGAKCLLFALLTSCRSGEARGAVWSEVDLDNATWAIPAERMKAGRPHRVPLSDHAVALLKSLPRPEIDADEPDYVFKGRAKGKPLSDMTLTLIMRRMGLEAVPHGMRSSFRDWAAERTHVAGEVAEMALAHAVGSKVESAYRRGDLFDKRVALMQQWGDFCTTVPSRKVIELRPARAG